MRISSKQVVLLLLLSALSGCQRRVAESEWELRDLPDVVDPDGDCQCVVRKGAAEISVPGTMHDLGVELGRMNAPRALCEVEGDFSVRVKTDCQLSPRTRAIPDRKPYQGAALILMKDDANYVRLDRAAVFPGTQDTVARYANFELRSNFDLDGHTPTEPSALNGFAIGEARMRYLRLDRAGDKVAAYVSDDGVKWLYLGRKIAKFPAKVKVGVAVVNSAKEPVTVRFSEFGTAARTAEAAKRVTITPLDKGRQDKLLAARLHGGMAFTFSQCARMFLVSSRIELPCGVALMTSSGTIAQTKLQPVFPACYQPTLREYLDAIAVQTSSQWTYDPTGKFFENEIENGPAEDLAIFEFTESRRARPFQVVLPQGWKAIDQGNRVTYVSSSFALGIDIHELGSYSTDDGTQENEPPQEGRGRGFLGVGEAGQARCGPEGPQAGKSRSLRRFVFRDHGAAAQRRRDSLAPMGLLGRKQVLSRTQHDTPAVRGTDFSRGSGDAEVVPERKTAMNLRGRKRGKSKRAFFHNWTYPIFPRFLPPTAATQWSAAGILGIGSSVRPAGTRLR